MLVTQGIAGVRQNNSESLLRPGDLAILTSWRPFTVRTTADDTGLVAGTTAVIPRHHIPLPTNTLERLAAHTIVGHDGSGALLASLLIGLTQQPPTPPADAMRLVSALVDLLTVSLNAAADLHPVDTVHRALFTTVRTFIQQRLADLDLTPSTVAAAHHVSTRTLNRLFEHHGDTVAEFIRRSRLDRCIRDLAEPTLRHHPVQEIATRWGFRSPTHFNRRFQSITGMTPSQYRRSQLDSNAPAASG
jgi:AraC-like DNA-binding protein